MLAGGIVSDIKTAPRDLGSEGGERAVVRAHTGQEGPFHALALRAAAAFIDKDGPARLA